MSKYHPIDVRYKGPSTSYRGSARQQAQPVVPPKTPPREAVKMSSLDITPPYDTPKAVPDPWGAAPAPSRRQEASPWGGAAQQIIRPRPRQSVNLFTVVMGVIKGIRNTYTAIIVLVLVMAFFRAF